MKIDWLRSELIQKMQRQLLERYTRKEMLENTSGWKENKLIYAREVRMSRLHLDSKPVSSNIIIFSWFVVVALHALHAWFIISFFLVFKPSVVIKSSVVKSSAFFFMWCVVIIFAFIIRLFNLTAIIKSSAIISIFYFIFRFIFVNPLVIKSSVAIFIFIFISIVLTFYNSFLIKSSVAVKSSVVVVKLSTSYITRG